MAGRLQQHVDRLFEGAPHQGLRFLWKMENPSIKLSKEKKKISNLSAYAVASDGHQMALGRHDVAEQSQVSVIDVKFVKLEDDVHYLLERL